MTRRRFYQSLTAIVAGLMLCLIPACGDSGNKGGDKIVIGVSIPSATHGWMAGVNWWAEQAMKEHPDIQWEFNTAGDPNEQAGQIDAMLVKGIDVLVVLPMDSDTPLPAIRKAKEQGVYVVSVDRGLREPVADVYVAGDNRAFGRLSAEYMVERLDGKGKIVILRGEQVKIDTERYEGAMDVFNKHPQIEVLASEHGKWNRAEAHRVMQIFLTRFPQIDAVWASDDDMAVGVEQALREANRLDEMWILGGAGMKDIVKRVKDGDRLFPADVSYPPGMIAAGVQLAVAHAKYGGDEKAVHKHIPAHLRVDEEALLGKDDARPAGMRHIKLDVHLITPENADEFYFPESVY